MAEAIDTFLNIEPIDLSNTCIKKDALKGEVAVITGSTSNVGLGYARAIAWAGGKVVVSGTNEKSGAEIERVINAETGSDSALFVKCDVSSESDIKNLAAKANAKFGKVDILINNAMNLSINGPVLTTPVSDFEKASAISGRGVMIALQEFVPAMALRKHGAVIYSTTQFHYHPPMIGGAMYTASKAAATSLVMSLANEVGPYAENGVGVFCVCPGGVNRIDPNKPNEHRFNMPGFDGYIPPEAGGAAIVYCIQNAGKLHGSGIIISEAFHAMNYPFPVPETAKRNEMRRLSDYELTMVLCNMGPGFFGLPDA